MPSFLQQKRLSYQPPIPSRLANIPKLKASAIKEKSPLSEKMMKLFPKTGHMASWGIKRGDGKPNRPLKVGALFSGGQASGGHNVLAGLFDGLIEIHSESRLIGFLNGPSGLVENKQKELTASLIDSVRNQGGFDLIGSGRTKIETAEQFQAAARSVKENRLDCLVIIGGDDSNTNAALLAEYFLENSIPTRVVGVPKTIDGDLRSKDIEISFGFDSASKIYSELIGNIAIDALSAKKYYHIIKLMGRSASHIALECALATCPNLALIGEEKKSLQAIIEDITDLIIRRKAAGKEYGVILLPEGLIEFIPEFKDLISILNQLLSHGNDASERLPEPHRSFFLSLPEKIRMQLLLDRDPHGNVQISQIETEQLILDLTKNALKERNVKFNAQGHFFGYEGRACFPSNFDAAYCYALGLFGAIAAKEELTGVILAIRNLRQPPLEWEPKAVPIVQMMDFEMRSGKEKPVIAKTLVDLKGRPYLHFAKERAKWRITDCYQTPGPIQFFGDSALTDSVPISLTLCEIRSIFFHAPFLNRIA
jgi:diphosphate-dependent phosphofructokinase